MTLPQWMPSWLASAVVHLLALNVLAFLGLPRGSDPRGPLTAITSYADPTAFTDLLDDSPLTYTLPSPPDAPESTGDTSATSHDPGTDGFDDDSEPSLANVDATFGDAIGDTSSSPSLANLLASPASTSRPVTTTAARFFGVEADGDTIVYIVDSSRSMIGPRFETAKHELLYSVSRLLPSQRFYVFFFDGAAKPMALGADRPCTPEPVYATRENQALLAAWVATVPNGPWTNPSAAVSAALQLRPDAIFLLTDGAFTDRGETQRLLSRENLDDRRRPKAAVHTIGLHSRAGEATLRTISQRHGGVYRFIPASP